MKTLLQFIKTTIAGGVLFLIPVTIIVILIGKVFRVLRPLVKESITQLHIETIIGVTLLTVLTAFILCLICFAAGLLIRLEKVKRLTQSIEDVILKLLPGYNYLKVMAEEQISDEHRDEWSAVLLKDGDGWVIAFLIEQNENGYTTVFIPECPRGDSGNTKIMLTSSLDYQPLSRRNALNCLRRFGGGASIHLQKQVN